MVTPHIWGSELGIDREPLDMWEKKNLRVYGDKWKIGPGEGFLAKFPSVLVPRADRLR
jgi:hypothetical protein